MLKTVFKQLEHHREPGRTETSYFGCDVPVVMQSELVFLYTVGTKRAMVGKVDVPARKPYPGWDATRKQLNIDIPKGKKKQQEREGKGGSQQQREEKKVEEGEWTTVGQRNKGQGSRGKPTAGGQPGSQSILSNSGKPGVALPNSAARGGGFEAIAEEEEEPEEEVRKELAGMNVGEEQGGTPEEIKEEQEEMERIEEEKRKKEKEKKQRNKEAGKRYNAMRLKVINLLCTGSQTTKDNAATLTANFVKARNDCKLGYEEIVKDLKQLHSLGAAGALIAIQGGSEDSGRETKKRNRDRDDKTEVVAEKEEDGGEARETEQMEDEEEGEKEKEEGDRGGKKTKKDEVTEEGGQEEMEGVVEGEGGGQEEKSNNTGPTEEPKSSTILNDDAEKEAET